VNAIYGNETMRLPFCGAPNDNFESRLETVICLLGVLANFSRQCDKECFKVCDEMEVSSRLSASQWPRHSQKLGFYKEMIHGRSFAHKYQEYLYLIFERAPDTVDEILDELAKLQKIEKNFLKVEVILTDTMISRVSTRRKISDWDLISTIASFMNMFSGITLIVFVEIIDYIVHVACHTRRARRRPKRQQHPHRNGVNEAAHVVKLDDFSVHF
jgi:hypothetical protein